MKETTKELRRELRKKDNLLELLDRFRRNDKSLTEHELSLLWVGVSDLAFNLAKKQYGEPQKGVKGQWYNGKYDESHLNRMNTILEFVLETDLNLSMDGVMFAIHRRFPWMELIVEFKTLGISYLENRPLTQRLSSSITKDIILGNQIKRELHDEKGRVPGHDEIIVEYTARLLREAKTIRWNRIKRFSERYRSYEEAKNKTSCLPFDETFFISE